MNDLSSIREALEDALGKCNWYAKNDARVQQEVDHALCVEVPSKIEDALMAISRLEASAGEPVAWMAEESGTIAKPEQVKEMGDNWASVFCIPLYAHHSPSSAPVELSAEDMYRIAHEVFPPDTTNDGEPWYTDRQSTLNIGAKEVIRHITKHYTLYPKQP